jgi:Raf kinase inhibitor-like YbhB/YbcL family protein
MFRYWVVLLALVSLLSGCQKDKKDAPTINLTSTSFHSGEAIPEQYTGDGKDISPPLLWGGEPRSTKSFAVICDDPDAPQLNPWVHWVVFDIPADRHGLDEGVPAEETLRLGGKQGKNDFGKLGYGGPAPPKGKVHHYLFKVYALDSLLNLKPGITKPDLEKAMKDHVLGYGEFMGTYQR